NMTITRSGMTPEAIEELVNRRVEEALAAYEATYAANDLEAESQSQNGSDDNNGNGGNGNGENGKPNENDRGARHVARECTYQDFMKCQPLNFKGTEGVVMLIRWFEKMKTVFHISNCPEKYQVKCKLHHEGPCTVKCGKCNKVGHMTRDCMNAVTVPATQRALVIRTVEQWENRGLRMLGGKAYVMGGGEANPDSKVVTGTFLLNNHYAFVLFDLGVDQSFVSTTFSTLLDIIPDTLDVSYVVELADRRISETNTVIRGCTLGLLGHPFNIDLMPVELGSFNVIIGMDWLANYHAVIVLPLFSGTNYEEGNQRQVEGKRLEDVPTVQDFPEDLPGLLPMRQVEF
ncbi:putative reverse transcriptase domain-containing protein, partial [Tanacetum coccineum]